MCDQDAKQPLSIHIGKQSRGLEQLPSTGSRRRRIWDLPPVSGCINPRKNGAKAVIGYMRPAAMHTFAVATNYHEHN
jgi:hypothetical protein